MNTRRLGSFTVSEIGLGCMSLSHAYDIPPQPDIAATLLNKALDLGYTHVDTAALYGFGANETLIGRALKDRRKEFLLASKGGMYGNAQGQREISGRPDMIRRNCEDSLTRLQTDVIDLYYLHRWDKRVPVEESIGALSELVKEGKIKTIGIMQLSCCFNVYNRDTKVTFKPINDLPGYVNEKIPVGACFPIFYHFFFWSKNRVF